MEYSRNILPVKLHPKNIRKKQMEAILDGGMGECFARVDLARKIPHQKRCEGKHQDTVEITIFYT